MRQPVLTLGTLRHREALTFGCLGGPDRCGGPRLGCPPTTAAFSPPPYGAGVSCSQNEIPYRNETVPWHFASAESGPPWPRSRARGVYKPRERGV